MQAIIPPVSKELLKAELTPERRLRSTNKAGNEIYIITYQQAPNVMREIGRLREIAFRAAGGGTGQSLDWDEFDTCEHPYYQLIVWDPEEELILGGYRFLPGCEMQFHADGQPHLATCSISPKNSSRTTCPAPWNLDAPSSPLNTKARGH